MAFDIIMSNYKDYFASVLESSQWLLVTTPDSKVHGANIGPIWGQQYPCGPHVGPINFAIWDAHWSEKP